jgi:hypothetical protein
MNFVENLCYFFMGLVENLWYVFFFMSIAHATGAFSRQFPGWMQRDSWFLLCELEGDYCLINCQVAFLEHHGVTLSWIMVGDFFSHIKCLVKVMRQEDPGF